MQNHFDSENITCIDVFCLRLWNSKSQELFCAKIKYLAPKQEKPV